MNGIIPIEYSEYCTTKEKRFIINDIICVGFSIVDDYTISILFALHQDLFDEYAYMNINVGIESEIELKKFKLSGMYIKELQQNQENALKIKDLCKYLKLNNLFTTDLNFTFLEDKGFYITKGIRNIGKKSTEVQEYQINDSIYVQLRLFKEFLKNYILSNKVFFDDNLKVISFNTATHCKLDGTIIEELKSANKATIYQYISHYTFQCGPTTIKVNYKIDSPKKINKAIREPMIYDQYTAQYGKDPTIICSIYEDSTDDVLVLIPENDKCVAVRLKNDLYKYTNFKDILNYIFYDVETTADTTVPHIKF